MTFENRFILCLLQPSLEFATWEEEQGNKYTLSYREKVTAKWFHTVCQIVEDKRMSVFLEIMYLVFV